MEGRHHMQPRPIGLADRFLAGRLEVVAMLDADDRSFGLRFEAVGAVRPELDGEIAGSGTDYASNLMMEISELGVENLSETASAIAKSGDKFTVTTDAGSHAARAVIVASSCAKPPWTEATT